MPGRRAAFCCGYHLEHVEAAAANQGYRLVHEKYAGIDKVCRVTVIKKEFVKDDCHVTD
jgi:hypothetical protein